MIRPANDHLAASTKVAVAATLGAAVFWGLWWWPLRWLANNGFGDFGATVAIYSAGILTLVPLVAWHTAPFRRGGPAILFSAVVFGFALAAWNLALLWGLVARVTLLFYLSPIWAVLLSYLVLGNKPDRVRLLAVLLGIAGAVLLLGGGVTGDMGEGADPVFGRGDAMGLLSGVLFAVSITGARKLPGEIDGRAQTLAALFVALIVSAAFGADALNAISAPSWPVFGVTLLVGALVLVPGTMMMLHGGNTLDPGRVTLLLLLEVPVAIVSAAILAGEAVGPRELTAAAMILIAAFLEARPGRANNDASRHQTGELNDPKI